MPDRLKATGARGPLRYGRGIYAAGEEFIASAPDAKTLVIAGLAMRVDDEPVIGFEPATGYQTADVKAEPPAAEPKRKRAPKGAYLRRDMRADE